MLDKTYFIIVDTNGQPYSFTAIGKPRFRIARDVEEITFLDDWESAHDMLERFGQISEHVMKDLSIQEVALTRVIRDIKEPAMVLAIEDRDETVYLYFYCGACRYEYPPQNFKGECPRCGNETMQEKRHHRETCPPQM